MRTLAGPRRDRPYVRNDRDAMAGAPPGTAGLVGRGAELQRGERLIDDALGGHGTLLLIGARRASARPP